MISSPARITGKGAPVWRVDPVPRGARWRRWRWWGSVAPDTHPACRPYLLAKETAREARGRRS